MMNNTLTVEDPETLAETLVDSLGGRPPGLPGYTVEELQSGGPGDNMGDEWVIGLVHDEARDLWITVNQDDQQSSVLEFATRADAEADIADTLASYADGGDGQ